VIIEARQDGDIGSVSSQGGDVSIVRALCSLRIGSLCAEIDRKRLVEIVRDLANDGGLSAPVVGSGMIVRQTFSS
jgi:hypothetical protein